MKFRYGIHFGPRTAQNEGTASKVPKLEFLANYIFVDIMVDVVLRRSFWDRFGILFGQHFGWFWIPDPTK